MPIDSRTGQCEVFQVLGKLPLHRPGLITQTAVVCLRCSDNMLNIRFRSTPKNFSCVGADNLAIQVFRDDPQLDALPDSSNHSGYTASNDFQA